jgi:hypothetical protein
MKADNRVYLDLLEGRLQQVDKPTSWFYDINPDDYKETPEARWYRVTSASSGRMYNALVRVVDSRTNEELGAHMKLFGNHWYVDAGDVDLSLAPDVRERFHATGLQAAASVVTAVGSVVMLAILWMGRHSGGHAPSLLPIVIGVAIIVVALIAADLFVHRGEE